MSNELGSCSTEAVKIRCEAGIDDDLWKPTLTQRSGSRLESYLSATVGFERAFRHKYTGRCWNERARLREIYGVVRDLGSFYSYLAAFI